MTGKRNEEAMMWEDFLDGLRDDYTNRIVRNALRKAGFTSIFKHGNSEQFRKEDIVVVVTGVDGSWTAKPTAFYCPAKPKRR